jgi:hypothetical protein
MYGNVSRSLIASKCGVQAAFAFDSDGKALFRRVYFEKGALVERPDESGGDQQVA